MAQRSDDDNATNTTVTRVARRYNTTTMPLWLLVVYLDGSKTRKSAPLVSARRLTWPLPCRRCRSPRVYPHPSRATPPLVWYTRLPLHLDVLFSLPLFFCLSLPPCTPRMRIPPPACARTTLLFYLYALFYLTLRVPYSLLYSEMIWKDVILSAKPVKRLR